MLAPVEIPFPPSSCSIPADCIYCNSALQYTALCLPAGCWAQDLLPLPGGAATAAGILPQSFLVAGSAGTNHWYSFVLHASPISMLHLQHKQVVKFPTFETLPNQGCPVCGDDCGTACGGWIHCEGLGVLGLPAL